MDVKQAVLAYLAQQSWYDSSLTYSDEDLIEFIDFYGREVQSGVIDMHRWYGMQGVVVQLGDYFISYDKFIITGDSSMADMDLEYSLSDFCVVEKKQRVITETYYE